MTNEDLYIKLEELINKKPPIKRVTEKIINFLNKLFIPVMIGILTYFTSIGANKIAKSQNELAKLQYEKASLYAEKQENLKYLELFYDDIASSDINKQKNAIGLLSIMNDSLAINLLNAIILPNKAIPKSLKKKIPSDLMEKILSKSLKSYKISIFYPSNCLEEKKKAEELEVFLREDISIEMKIKVDTIGEDNIKLKRKKRDTQKLSAMEIWYTDSEDDIELVNFIVNKVEGKFITPLERIKRIEVESDNTISIFIFDKIHIG